MSYKILIAGPPYRPLPVDGYGAVEKITILRGEALNRLGLEVSYILPPSSSIEISKTSYYLNKIPEYHGSKPKATFVYRAFKNLAINRDFDVILNETPLYDPLNFMNFNKVLGYNNRIDILHGNAIRGTYIKKPHFLRFPILGALNKHLNNKLVSNGWSSVYFPNGIAIPDLNKITETPDDYFVFIGQIIPTKGVDNAIKLAMHMGKKLFLIGPIRDREYFKSIVKPLVDNKRIILVGEVPWLVLEGYLRNASALLFTSTNNDPQPTVLLEALSYGVPIIATLPGFYSGFYDICNPNNSIIGNSTEEISQNYRTLLDFSRRRIYEDTKREWSWENVIKRWYFPIFDRITQK